ncbi:MAG: hypothetical protein JRG95_24560, partial [Deltaproteobacteria bacterium]|nr:hypothetical protein [Deltaproteobacteria bacterium]
MRLSLAKEISGATALPSSDMIAPWNGAAELGSRHVGTTCHDPIVLMGAGHGEALGLLEAQPPGGQRAVRVEVDGLALAEVAVAVLRRLGISDDAREPWDRLEEAIRKLGGDGLLLLVSGASGMLAPTAAGLRDWIDRLAGELHVVVAMGPPDEEVLAQLAPIFAEIQVGVLGPRPAAVRARRILAGAPTGDGRKTGTVTMAQLAKARRRRIPGPEQGFAPRGVPAEPEPRPINTPASALPPVNAPSTPRDDAASQSREPLLQPADPSATSPDETPLVPIVGWRRVFVSIAATLLVIGAAWWALGPVANVYRFGDRDPGAAPRVEERLPQVSVGPPRTALVPKPVPRSKPVPAPSPKVPAALPRPAPEIAPQPIPEREVRTQKTPAKQDASVHMMDDSVEPERRAELRQAAPVVAVGVPAPADQAALPDAPASEPLTEAPPEYIPPIVHDPKRVPEILRIGPPSSGAVAIEADEPVA